MSFFDEVAKETMGKDRHPKWNRDHTYHLKIVNYEPAFQTRSSGVCTVFEMEVLASSCREHSPGQKLALMVYHTSDAAKGNVAKMLRAALGVPNTHEGKAYYEAHVQPHLAAYAQDPRYFVGREITVTTETRLNKKGEEYVHYTPEPARRNAAGGFDPLAERETKPPLVHRNDRAQAAAAPPGYGYPPPAAAPPGYGYPPAAPPGYGYPPPAAAPQVATPAAPPGYGYPPKV